MFVGFDDDDVERHDDVHAQVVVICPRTEPPDKNWNNIFFFDDDERRF